MGANPECSSPKFKARRRKQASSPTPDPSPGAEDAKRQHLWATGRSGGGTEGPSLGTAVGGEGPVPGSVLTRTTERAIRVSLELGVLWRAGGCHLPNQRQQLLPLSLTSPGLRFASSCQVLGAARNPDVSMDAPNRFNINRLFFKIEHTWEPNGVPSGHSWPTGRPLATPARALTAIILWRVTSPGYSRGHGGPARSGGSPQGPHGRSNPRGTGLASGIQTSGLG